MASFSPVSSINENTSQTEISSFRSQDLLEGNYDTSFSTSMNIQNQFLHCNHASVEGNYENASLRNGSILHRSSESANEPLEEENCENEEIPFWEKDLGNQAFLVGEYENAPVDNFQCQLVPFPSSGDVLISESIGSEALVQENCGLPHSSNAELVPLSVSVPTNEQIPESGTSLRTQSSSEEKCDPHNVHSVLVSGSAMCLDLDDIKSHVRVIIEKKLDEHIPLSVSAPRNSIVKDYNRTSKYHGVTRHFWTGKFEAHLWDSSYIREGQRRKGKQVFLGQYDIEEKAGRAYDLAALKYWGPSACTRLNFPISNYEEELEEMNHMSREEFVMYIRRKSSFKIGSSIYRGVTRYLCNLRSGLIHTCKDPYDPISGHGDGRWQARISGIPGKRGLHLGTFGSEEEAAKAYDIASIKFRGIKAYTNFDVSNYCHVDFKELEGQPAPKKLKKNLASSTTAVSKSNPPPDLTCTVALDPKPC